MGSETIKVTPDEIDAVAKNVVGPAYDKVQAALASFEGTSEGSGAFGGSGPGEHLAQLHASVKDVFVKTVTGVGEDLDTFKHNLHKTAAGWRDTDETNAERAQTLASHLGGTAAAATQAGYHDGRKAQGQKLAVDPSLAKPGADQDAQDPQGGQGDHGHQGAPGTGGAADGPVDTGGQNSSQGGVGG